MKKLILSTLSISFITSITFSQHSFNPQNAIAGENIEYCHQHTLINRMQDEQPEMYQNYLSGREQLRKETKNYVEEKSGVVYTIPLVFHVLHNNGIENISDEQIYDAVAILNRDFRRLNTDANTVQTPFLGMPADIEIEFKLATKAPNGDCFKGITRTVSPMTSNGDYGEDQISAIISGNNVYQGVWPHDRYLNIYVAEDIGGAGGYTFRPFWSGSADESGMYYNGIFVLSRLVGSIGTSSEGTSRVLSHEVGHWLDLAHTWGQTNDPEEPYNCYDDDEVQDTPLCIGSSACALYLNTCDDTDDPYGYSSWTTDVIDNIENYMDYSYCNKMFTPGQASKMRAAIVSSIGDRSNIWTTSNLNLVGAIANPPLCKANFSTEKTVVCSGETVQFNDESFNNVTGWSWTFTGGTPSNSSSQNPSVTYSSPGTYTVSLIATDGGTSQTETKTAYITVLSAGSELPFFEGFESYNTMADANGKWFVESPGNTTAFTITNTAAHSGSKSVRLLNYSQTAGSIDELTSSPVNLANESLNNVTLSFRYAYRKKTSTNNDYLKIYFSNDCGDSWSMKKTYIANTMSGGGTIATGSWTPTQTDWITTHIPFNNSSFSQFLVDNFRYRFSFEGNGGNNFFLDDINIYNNSESLGINENEFLNEVKLFPNPNNGEVNVSFYLKTAQHVQLNIMNISGKRLKSTTINGNTGENIILLDNSDFASGVYLIEMQTSNSNKTLQFIKK